MLRELRRRIPVPRCVVHWLGWVNPRLRRLGLPRHRPQERYRVQHRTLPGQLLPGAGVLRPRHLPRERLPLRRRLLRPVLRHPPRVHGRSARRRRRVLHGLPLQGRRVLPRRRPPGRAGRMLPQRGRGPLRRLRRRRRRGGRRGLLLPHGAGRARVLLPQRGARRVRRVRRRGRVRGAGRTHSHGPGHGRARRLLQQRVRVFHRQLPAEHGGPPLPSHQEYSGQWRYHRP
mmetsp:Transcript_33913/g.107738  ORF Transcript_33913/g.107738 Transcript_33913/m.107738 type:complete len:230 (-) Transcript_33913:693-1382(-)